MKLSLLNSNFGLMSESGLQGCCQAQRTTNLAHAVHRVARTANQTEAMFLGTEDLHVVDANVAATTATRLRACVRAIAVRATPCETLCLATSCLRGFCLPPETCLLLVQLGTEH